MLGNKWAWIGIIILAALVSLVPISFMRAANPLVFVLLSTIYNVGANFGRTAGAGIDTHLHFHIVPRWNGDTNFMPVLNNVKVVSEGITKTYSNLNKALTKLSRKKK